LEGECAREGAAADASPVNPQGAILVVDVERALKDPCALRDRRGRSAVQLRSVSSFLRREIALT
jgi:hypothetical protein